MDTVYFSGHYKSGKYNENQKEAITTVSKKHLPEHLGAFVFQRNNAGNDRERFFFLLESVLRF